MNTGRHQAKGRGSSTPGHAECHALQIATAVDVAWHRGHGPNRPEVVLGTVATLALASLRTQADVDLEAQVRSLTPDEFGALARRVWASTLRARIDLIHVVYPLVNWLFDMPDPQLLARAKRAADAGLEAGLARLIGSDRRLDADVLGPLLGLLKSRTATHVNAQMYTPGDLARALATKTIYEPEPGQSICDDAVGTGGLLCAAAQVVRIRGGDPAAMQWFGADIDQLAVAATAVNSLIWGLGPRVFLFVGDVLVHPDWPEQALRHRDEVLRTADRIRDMMAALEFLTDL